ncbi:MAG: peptidoglycan-binding domain-containing protein [Candidatus Omnitrophica bacterium]|nr:peptidoglycan-binding domain-containing protein [Candidatus Omnitrophota bacterium]MDD5770998.1 peptidoglycan-binding domain-containing protein [Candidatus Omnitrophota bacterium]
MGKKILLLAVAAAFIFSLNGCASSRKKDLEIQGLRNQVAALESQVPVAKTDTVCAPLETEKEAEVVETPTPRQIQAALKNAGYYQGVIDGKIGRKSRQAIRDFQKANNLSVDGKVGKNTWAALKEYLQKKVK